MVNSMKPSYEDIVEFTKALDVGYLADDRRTVGNERLVFVTVLMIVTKRSLVHVLNIRKSQFKKYKDKCIFRDLSPRANNYYRIEFPMILYEYLENYCKTYNIKDDMALFNLNSEYVGRRFRELCRLQSKPFSASDLQTTISYGYNTKNFKSEVEKYILLLPICEEYYYFSHTGTNIAKKISKFADDCLMLEKVQL